ncbi:hypothetical protein TBK1r_25610 [Stieleria magnilauensis]|uniref:Fibronectin type-III domain-containing protein n=2 Tax=Stieleria magnilauensis TaxID=2527963 RepID=A0ABX5XUS9_9BACT|nr:hypothetical protein TBK1r_25610 [Planctomycetes bacterium TBK1r]
MGMLGQMNTRRNRRGARALGCPMLAGMAAAALLLLGSPLATWCSVAMAAEPESELPPDPESPPALAFVEPQLGVLREGYFTLEWSAVDGAVSYRVRDRADEIVYQGVATKSFQSGLSDGVYRYRVEAIGDDGQVLATSEPAVATVKHWGLFPSLGLFAIGAVVVSGIVFVILRGRWIEKQIAGVDAGVSSIPTSIESGDQS